MSSFASSSATFLIIFSSVPPGVAGTNIGAIDFNFLSVLDGRVSLGVSLNYLFLIFSDLLKIVLRRWNPFDFSQFELIYLAACGKSQLFIFSYSVLC